MRAMERIKTKRRRRRRDVSALNEFAYEMYVVYERPPDANDIHACITLFRYGQCPVC